MRNKKFVIISLCMMLIPLAIGLFYFGKLPDSIPTNFDLQGNVISYETKFKAMFTTPIVMIFVQMFLVFMLNKDPRKKFQSDKLYIISLFIIPVITTITTSISIMYTFNSKINIARVLSIFIGFMFIITGNFLPKAKRNYTMGIRTPWTLDSDYVWEKTHRLGGYTFVVGGILLLIASLLLKTESNIIFFILIFIPSIIPPIYSYFVSKN
ncbi:putative membrane protein [Peptoniphilus olsenii]|uniref:Membrane protein n=1 Tax=Peptoniphilus olsenii TaxID=411570 RepID=A0ABV2J8H7_9FIRM